MNLYRSLFGVFFVFGSLSLSARTHISMKLISPENERTVVQELNAHVLARPASTMKLFTAWIAMNEGSKTDAYLSQMLRLSDNAMANVTLAKIGGASELSSLLSRDGVQISEENFKAVDGSGLSKSNRVTCDLQVQLLEHIYDSPEYERFRNLLARPGREGTLDKRLLNFRSSVYAKTGTLKKTSALSGYAETQKGTLLFCIISEDFAGTWTQERARIDGLLTQKIKNL